jgi:adenylate cyclase
MLEIAIHSPRQHRQFHHDGGRLVLARTGNSHTSWAPVAHEYDDENGACVEILPQADHIALALAGCEAECQCGRACDLKGNCEIPVPAAFTIGDTRFEITDSSAAASKQKRTLQKLLVDKASVRSQRGSATGPSPATLSRWFAALGTLNHWATSLQELYVQAARCAVEAIGLDGAMVLRRRDNDWEIAASHLPHPELGIHYDVDVLNSFLESLETRFHGAKDFADFNPQSAVRLGSPKETRSPQSPALVVSPLRNSRGTLVGAIYGYRSVRTGNSRRGIRYLEAHWLELLAGAVSDAMSRLERESETDRRRALLERAYAIAPDQPERKFIGETREVSLLFADLRDFTRMSHELEMDVVYELLGQVMDVLTAAVMDHDGLVLDYYGDGLAAMWNAPADQADHAELACRAGVRMLELLPDVAADWAGTIEGGLRLGVGIHTGMARVGNAGSSRRTKYGPRGANVNLTSRVESATKELGVPMIVTAATAKQLSNRLATHRVCRVRLAGVDNPVDLFSVELAAAAQQSAADWQLYEAALRAFEKGDFETAASTLSTLMTSAIETPAQFLASVIEREQSRRQNRRRGDDGTSNFNGIITLNRK